MVSHSSQALFCLDSGDRIISSIGLGASRSSKSKSFEGEVSSTLKSQSSGISFAPNEVRVGSGASMAFGGRKIGCAEP